MDRSIYKFILLVIFCSLSLSDSWYFYNNNPWDINTSSRSSALAGINFQLSELDFHKSYKSKLEIYNSSMYGGLVTFNNIFYTFKFNNIVFLGNTFNLFRGGFLNRKIKDIPYTHNAWNHDIFTEPMLSNINYDLIEHHNQKDFSLFLLIPFNNKFGDFGVNMNALFSKLNYYHSYSINLNFIWYLKNSRNYSLEIAINNLISYRRYLHSSVQEGDWWGEQTIERFYPYLSLINRFKLYKGVVFLQLDELYLDSKYLKSSYNINESFNFGIEYPVNNKLDLLVGINDSFTSFGLNIKISNLLFGYTYLDHIELDNSHQISMTYLLNQEE